MHEWRQGKGMKGRKEGRKGKWVFRWKDWIDHDAHRCWTARLCVLEFCPGDSRSQLNPQSLLLGIRQMSSSRFCEPFALIFLWQISSAWSGQLLVSHSLSWGLRDSYPVCCRSARSTPCFPSVPDKSFQPRWSSHHSAHTYSVPSLLLPQNGEGQQLSWVWQKSISVPLRWGSLTFCLYSWSWKLLVFIVPYLSIPMQRGL